MKKVDSFFYEFAESLQKARNSSNRFAYKCNCPNCETKAIKSHLIQRHPTLESIADVENKVLQFEDNWEDARSERWNLYTSRIRGINDAMQYPLFCSSHDSSLFKELESHNSIPFSKRDCLLLAYRAACSVRHQEERRMHFYGYKVKENSGDLNGIMLENSWPFIRRMDAVIDNLWNALEGNDNNYMFRMIAMPYIPIAASDCIVDENDYINHITEQNYKEPLNCYFINLIPDNDRLLLLLGCDTRYDKEGEYQHIITDFPANCDIKYQIFIETIWGILIKCRNWCCSPLLLENPLWKPFFENYEKVKVNVTLNQ